MPRKNVKFGSLLPIPTAPVDKLIEIAKVNEGAGFDSIWAPDHLLFVPPGTVPEAWTILTAVAMATKRVMIGTCVTDPHRYHPAVLAQRIATVDQISVGRVILGLGAGEAMNLEPFGIKWKRPVSKLIEAATIMRKLWTGEIFSYEGKFWNLKDAFLQIKPFQSRLPIYFGANSPRMLRLAGEMADGWLPTPLSPELYKKRLKLVEEGAKMAGRSIDEIDTGVYLYTSITDEAEEAYKQLDMMKPMIVSYPQLLEEAGYDIDLPEEISSLSYPELLPTGEWIEKFLRYGELIPTEAAVEFSIAGTVEECIEQIDRFVKAGVKHFLLINMGPRPRRVMEIYGKEIIPHFRNNTE
jgi:5,10-methylenetetrahydromethanopterin reductase